MRYEPEKTCVVIKTINSPEAIAKWLDVGLRVIVVGSPDSDPYDWRPVKHGDIVYLSYGFLEDRWPELFHCLPTRPGRADYALKMLGYLYARSLGYDYVFETDDDNYPLPWFHDAIKTGLEWQGVQSVSGRKGWLNSFAPFGYPYVWPRGFPLNLPKHDFFWGGRHDRDSVYVAQFMIDGEPDRDAYHRLVHPEQKQYVFNGPSFVSKSLCPFNSQATMWDMRYALSGMYFPVTVSWRETDIIRSYLYQTERFVLYCKSAVIQERNEHDLIVDLREEDAFQMRAVEWSQSNVRNNYDDSLRFWAGDADRELRTRDLWLDAVRKV